MTGNWSGRSALWMIDPRTAPWYGKTTNELEEILLFCVLVAGKNAMSTARALDKFLQKIRHVPGSSPFGALRRYKSCFPGVSLGQVMRSCGIGCYTSRSAAVTALLDAKLDLRTCTASDLQEIPGIGPKTARFFLLHTRPGVRVACLDTHVLKYLADYHGINVPKSTPTGNRYLELESAYLSICARNEWDPAQKDIEIWREYSGN